MQEAYWAAGLVSTGIILLGVLIRVVWLLATLKALVSTIATNDLPHIRQDIAQLSEDFKQHMVRHHEQ